MSQNVSTGSYLVEHAEQGSAFLSYGCLFQATCAFKGPNLLYYFVMAT